MRILFADDTSIEIEVADNPLRQVYQHIYKHLQKIDIPFRPWDNPYIRKHDAAIRLKQAGERMSVDVDIERCQLQDQDYLNQLHVIYEKNYDGDPRWLDFHEGIHNCEKFGSTDTSFHIDYREKAGLLEVPFEHKWTEYMTSTVNPGDVFVKWSELGKIPYVYWRDQEPNDINRLCELSKPWLTLRPKLLIAIDHKDYLADKDQTKFESWWAQYRDAWCQHWKIENWTLEHMVSVVPLGKLSPTGIEKLQICLQKKVIPIRVQV